jgi:predicted O-methyltransferase YrrM
MCVSLNPFISLDDLAMRMRMSLDEIIRFVIVNNIPYKKNKGILTLTKDSFVHFLDVLEKERPPLCYPIPASLEKHNNIPWKKTLYEIYSSKYAHPACMSPEQGLLLHSIVLNISPNNVVEIGTFLGVSAIWIASALNEIGKGKIYCIDLFQSILPFPYSNCIYVDNPLKKINFWITEAGLESYISFIPGNSHVIGKIIKRHINANIDFLLIDGDHSVHGAAKDFQSYEPHVNKGGYIMLHDIFPESGHAGPRWVIDHLIHGRADLEICEFLTRPSNFGIAVIRKK